MINLKQYTTWITSNEQPFRVSDPATCVFSFLNVWVVLGKLPNHSLVNHSFESAFKWHRLNFISSQICAFSWWCHWITRNRNFWYTRNLCDVSANLWEWMWYTHEFFLSSNMQHDQMLKGQKLNYSLQLTENVAHFFNFLQKSQANE